MARPWVRLVFVLAGVAAIATAGMLTWSAESGARAADAAFRQAEDAGRRAFAGAAELAGAQQAYVAVGQGQDFWFARVTVLARDLDEVLAVFKGHLASPQAVASADEAAAIMQDFRQVDARARDLARAGQLSQASDVVFGDGFDVTGKLSAAIAQASVAERVGRDAALGQLRHREALVLASGAGVVAIVLLLLIPGGRPSAAAQASLSLSDAPSRLPVSRGALDDLNDLGVVDWPAAAAAPAAPPGPPAVDLKTVAAICSDFARLTDTRAIPALLERAAALLDATGIVVWIADPDGRELTPIVVHGYPPQMASRLGTIAREAANVTASAYRTGLLQTVHGDTFANGAVAAPLVGAGGCLGVMAVEMKNGGEQREPLLAAATIIASQLSTLVGPPSARTRTEAAG